MELSGSLKLQFPAVEWAIANADGTRLAEFLAVYRSHPKTQDDAVIPNLTELILHSLDEAIQQRRLDARTRMAAQECLEDVRERQVMSWRSSINLNRATFRSPSLQDFLTGYQYNPRAILSDELGLRFPAVDWVMFNGDPGEGDRIYRALSGYVEG